MIGLGGNAELLGFFRQEKYLSSNQVAVTRSTPSRSRTLVGRRSAHRCHHDFTEYKILFFCRRRELVRKVGRQEQLH